MSTDFFLDSFLLAGSFVLWLAWVSTLLTHRNHKEVNAVLRKLMIWNYLINIHAHCVGRRQSEKRGRGALTGLFNTRVQAGEEGKKTGVLLESHIRRGPYHFLFPRSCGSHTHTHTHTLYAYRPGHRCACINIVIFLLLTKLNNVVHIDHIMHPTPILASLPLPPPTLDSDALSL